MKYAKNAAYSQQRADRLTARTFVRAAWFSTLLVGGVVSSYLLLIAVYFRDDLALAFGLVVIPLMTLAIWMIAGVLGTLLLVPRWLWTNRRNRFSQAGFAKAAHSSVWDNWLDGAT
jgi:hypothetical protein